VSNRFFHRVYGFSLIEMLIVISIVTVLISLLLPSLSASREAARTIMCQSRARDIYTLSQHYSDNNRDWMFASLVWASDTVTNAHHLRDFRVQILSVAPDHLKNWGYTNSFKNSIVYCASEEPVQVPGTALPATYYTDSMARGLIYHSGVSGYWVNGFLGYGNVQFGGTLSRRRDQTKPDIVYFGEIRGNDAYTFGYIYGGWSGTRYRHGQDNTVANMVRVDGAVKAVRNPITNYFASGDLRWMQ
jgi:prepilin-type N-terminal cleavage/methylation domain-containing protein